MCRAFCAERRPLCLKPGLSGRLETVGLVYCARKAHRTDTLSYLHRMTRRHGMHDRKAKLRDPRPAYQKLLPQDYHLRKIKLFIRYSVVSADPAGSPKLRDFQLSWTLDCQSEVSLGCIFTSQLSHPNVGWDRFDVEWVHQMSCFCVSLRHIHPSLRWDENWAG